MELNPVALANLIALQGSVGGLTVDKQQETFLPGLFLANLYSSANRRTSR